ncbi:MAG: putative porin [Bacteroides sp.]|nr:putative porin [Bacteroides sp.]
MRRILVIYLLLLTVCFAGKAQFGSGGDLIDPETGMVVDDPSQTRRVVQDSIEIISLPPTVYMWRIDEKFGTILPVPADTLQHNFQNTNLMEGMYGHYNYLGNLGSPRLSRIFFDREENSSFLFLDPYSAFMFTPGQFNFTNSSIPYTNLTYYKAGSKRDGEERFKSYFSVNVNKKFAFGFNFDYLYGRGRYAYQNTAFFNATLFASYISEKYQMHAMYSNFSLKMAENGGIEDDRYITNPEEMSEGKKTYEPANIPTNLDAVWNRYHSIYGYLTHRYNVGFEREVVQPLVVQNEEGEGEVQESSEQIYEFVPVTSFIHTFKLERSRRHFTVKDDPNEFFPIPENNPGGYIRTDGLANDTTVYIGAKNMLGISLLEGFNKYAKAGLTAYVEHEVRKYTLMGSDSTHVDEYTEHEVYAGGRLSKQEGSLLHYNATGEIGFAGKALGQFRLKGDMDLNFRLFKDTVNLIAHASVTNTLPSFFMRHYHSNYYWWDNEDMDKEFRTRVEGELNIQRWRTNLRAGVENIKNYTYFNADALPTQESGNIQVLSVILRQDFKLGPLHLDSEVAYQKSSNNTVLPLPDLSVYSNLYLQTTLAKKVLSVQLGADIRYFTKYYAPDYAPGVNQFHIQGGEDKIELGGYPIINVYANIHLKRTRLFAMMYHVNQGSGNAMSFLVPHYPLNPRMLKLGVSWNFYD